MAAVAHNENSYRAYTVVAVSAVFQPCRTCYAYSSCMFLDVFVFY